MMMKMECGNGHIYDADLYPSCPYCSNSFQSIRFGGTAVGDAGKTMPVAGMGQEMRVSDVGKTMPVGGMGQENRAAEAGYTMPVSGWQGNAGGQPVDGGGVTLPPRGYQRERRVDQENKTTGLLGKRIGVEPVVGWLVCIEGSAKGTDYRVLGKINTIGKSEKMDICIKGDPSITGDTHARLGYDPKHNNFHIIPANGSNNTYLNDEPVYVPMKLNAYDVLEMGETKLVFVPFCEARFSWEDGVRTREGGTDGTA